MSYDNYNYQLCQDMDQIGEPAAENLVGFKFLLGVTEVVGLVLIILMIVWTKNFQGGFAWTDNPTLQFNWHPLLMTIGLVFLYANGMLIYRSQRTVRKRRLKLLHGGIMIFTLVMTVVALIAVFDMHNLKKPPIPNMYTLHSWVGLSSVILFACQWLAGFISFLFPGLHVSIRSAYLPIHVYFGTAGFVGVIASCLLGLNEKAIFALSSKYSQFVPEGILINVMGLLFVIFGGLTVYLVSHTGYKRQPRTEDDILLTGRQ
ncbi:transmembrane ascorbate-dependent reductase CYB561 isoform X1 [Microplitis demolitor]|uniref:transmembrane ascorbate-dependent reductase CYB561 isoform X1 n=2 Tax=Microplitis demolitor TaxID=69319 RepID=UPI00235B69AA|nr:transmembrane ascorbate-dependent reductase CYB561 isoform X1 [Microplitis demolitor]